MKKILASAAAAIGLPIGVAIADNPPEVKEGLWSIHTQVIQNPVNKKIDQSWTLCRHHAYDQYVLAQSKTMKGCTTVRESSQGGKQILELHCVVQGTVVESKRTTTFQGDTAVHVESHATYAPALSGTTEQTSLQDQKYLGSCPAEARPGDVTTSDGKVTHSWNP